MYSYDARGALAHKVIYVYNAKGNLIEDIWLKPDGNVYQRQTYTYDKHNNKIEESHYDAKGITGKTYSKYDNLNNLIFVLDSNIRYIGGLPSKKVGDDIYSKTFKYEVFDKKGNWLKKSLMIDGKPVHIEKREIVYFE